MKKILDIKPLRGSFQREDSKVSLHFEFATEAEAEAAFAAITIAASKGLLNIIAGVPPIPNTQEQRG